MARKNPSDYPYFPGMEPEKDVKVPDAASNVEKAAGEIPQEAGLPELETVHCQYCEDSGDCDRCDRGRLWGEEHKGDLPKMRETLGVGSGARNSALRKERGESQPEKKYPPKPTERQKIATALVEGLKDKVAASQKQEAQEALKGIEYMLSVWDEEREERDEQAMAILRQALRTFEIK